MNGSKGINIFLILNEKSGFYLNEVLGVKLICDLKQIPKKEKKRKKETHTKLDPQGALF